MSKRHKKFKQHKENKFKNHKLLKSAVRGGYLTYEEYISSELWIDKKRWFEEVHPRKCIICNDINVDCHHIVYPKQWGREKGYHLAWMCQKHHLAFHKWINKRLGIKTLRDMRRPFKKFVDATKDEEWRIYLNKPDNGNYIKILDEIKIETREDGKIITITKENRKIVLKKKVYKPDTIPGVYYQDSGTSKILFSSKI